MITRLLLVLFALLAVIGWADVERPLLRLATGREEVRIVVIVPRHADHRALLVSGATADSEGNVTWERTSGVELDGDQAPASHTFLWQLPKPNLADVGSRTLTVQAAVVCASASGQAFIP
jgi:hypothetical protein